MLFTADQLAEIRRIIDHYHTMFGVNFLGLDSVDSATLSELYQEGLVDSEVEAIKDAYLYGQLAAIIGQEKAQKMSYGEFKEYLQKHPIPLSAAEQRAVELAQQRAGQYCKGLGNRISNQTGAVLIEADQKLRAKTEANIRDLTAKNIQERNTIQQLKTDLAWKAQDWQRDWGRIAATEKQTAMEQGKADHYRKRHGGDTWVSKIPAPDACPHCKRLFLGKDGHPKIFRLSDLEANGTNVGKKVDGWLPVVGTVHPHCRCMLVRVPDGFGYDETGDLVPSGKYGERMEDAGSFSRALVDEEYFHKGFPLQGHTKFQGIPIAIENKKGSVRSWKASDGTEGETLMSVHYGYVKRTTGLDEDEIDVFLGEDQNAPMAYVIEQQDPHTGIYDEQKCMLGFSSQAEAERIYQAHYDRPDFELYVSPMPVEQFKQWLAGTRRKKGEMEKSRFILPLEKGIQPYLGAVNSPAGNRSPSPGTSANYIFEGIPERPVPKSIIENGYSPTVEALLAYFSPEYSEENPMKRDRATYDFQKPVRHLRPLEIPEDWKEAVKEIREGKDQRMKYLLWEGTRNIRRPLNYADMEKGGPYIGPRGGKWADPEHTIPWEDVEDEAKRRKVEPEKVAGAIKKIAPKLPGGLSPKEHVQIAHTFLKKHQQALPKLTSGIKKLAKGAQVQSRTKALESALEKIVRKPKYGRADNLQDGTGVRAIHKTVAKVKSTVRKLKRKYEVIEEDNYIDNPMGSYRSHHLILRDPDTKLVFEVQVRTKNQNVMADWSHDTYKPRNKTQKKYQGDPAVQKYEMAMADYFWKQDTGQQVLSKPDCPPPVKIAFYCL